MLSTIKTRVLPLSWILSIPLLGLIYSTLNNSTRGAHSLVTDLDRSIPFVKSFILPYVGWEFFIHTLTSFLMIRGIQGSPVKNFWNTMIITGGAICIILSTLFVKQHVIFDVMGAMLLGEIVLQSVSRLNPWSEVRSSAWIKKPSLS